MKSVEISVDIFEAQPHVNKKTNQQNTNKLNVIYFRMDANVLCWFRQSVTDEGARAIEK